MSRLRRIVLGIALAASLPASLQARQQPAPTPTPRPEPAERQPKYVGEGPGGKALEIAAGPGSIIGKDELILKEYVDIKYGDTRVQADYVHYVPATKDATALGNVILDQGTSRLTAERVTYNLDTETGVFYSARGYAEPSYYFEAERVEKISKDEMVLYNATFTACTQPVPYWSFKIGRALVRQNNYAYLHNPRFKIGHLPVFYSPYLIWPVKADRASGLLFPEFGFSGRSGTILSNAIYWAIRRNMDATFFVDYMSLAGLGTGAEYRYMPSETGRGFFTGYFIRDQVAADENDPNVPTDRWVINYGHNQVFEGGWKMVATANFISDFDYYRDFERDLRLSTNPQALSTLFITHTWGFYSFNFRGERREQLINVAVPPAFNQTFTFEEQTITRYIEPGLELRGRRQRLGRTPLYLTLESSANLFDKGTTDAQYGRLDVYPVISSQVSPVPWLDVDASVGVRDTYYTKSQISDLGCDNLAGTRDPGEGNGLIDHERDRNGNGIFDAADDVGCGDFPLPTDFGYGNGRFDSEETLITDDPFNRRVYQAGLNLIGPKFSRVFDRPHSKFSPQYKNTVEPQIRYNYVSDIQDPERAIQFDPIDLVGGYSNRVTYALVTRLYAKRPVGNEQEFEAMFGAANNEYVGGEGSSTNAYAQTRAALQRRRDEMEKEQGALSPEQKKAEDDERSKRLNTVEIASLEISQDYSFLGPISRSTALGTATGPLTDNKGPVRATLRFNPSLKTSIDVRGTYDILFRQVRDASLSANVRSLTRGYVDVTWSSVRELEAEALFHQGFGFEQPFHRSQIGLNGETSFFGHRVLFGLQTNYELGDVGEGEPRLRDQRYRFGYNTQCCGFQFEYLNRNFVGSSQNEFRFLINLKGIGSVIDFQSGSTGTLPGTFPGIMP